MEIFAADSDAILASQRYNDRKYRVRRFLLAPPIVKRAIMLGLIECTGREFQISDKFELGFREKVAASSGGNFHSIVRVNSRLSSTLRDVSLTLTLLRNRPLSLLTSSAGANSEILFNLAKVGATYLRARFSLAFDKVAFNV